MEHFVTVACPYCGEPIDLRVEPLPEPQDYVEDCAVCCRPIEVRVDAGDGGGPRVRVRSGDAL